MMALESIAGCTAHGALYDLYVDHVRVVPAPAPPPANWVDHGVVAPVGMPTWGPSTIATRWPLQPDTPAIRDLVVAGDGMVYGLAEPDRLFVLDPARGAILRDEPLRDYGGVSGFQAPRCMTIGPDGAIYALFRSAVVRIEPGTCAHRGIAYPDATITAGIAILGNRLYFGCGPRLLSCAIAAAE